MTRRPLPTPTLHTARLRLRPFADADADGLFALHTNTRVLRYWDAPPWTEHARAEALNDQLLSLQQTSVATIP
jgi:RimJ/RimL family protein N-acetyltransferase